METGAVTAKLVAELEQVQALAKPNALLTRLATILVEVAVVESARRGLLGDLDQLVPGGDGSPLRTGANRCGHRVCGHRHHERCDCAELYTDPDAQWGYDNHRKQCFFGHHFYEVSCSAGDHDLPLAIRLDPGNTSDFTASLRTFEHLRKTLRDHGLPWNVAGFIADAGHDAEPIYRHFVRQDTRPIIPLEADAVAWRPTWAAPSRRAVLRTPRAVHPTRPDVKLSRRGVPTCQAGCEMAYC